MTKLSANADGRNRVAQGYAAVTARIATVCANSGRNPTEITLLAVSKQQTVQRMRAAYDLGQRHFGENYLQEARAKQSQLPADCIWHFIGPVQSNKTREIAEHFAWLHSLDRWRIAQRLAAQRPETLPPLKVCVQINIDAEASKSGLPLSQAPAFCQSLAELPNLQLMGLMCLPRADGDPAATHAAFTRLRALRDKLSLPVLSMGMSADLELAIAAGSTILRIGSALFGPRESPNESG